MAFNFNWSPLIADTTRVRDMLTTALNKSPKPPIIVDDIIVTELNLGKQPPELEILEIGDLAEDRFRGIFKMSYTGDAFLTLKTRVQANPLNTYLSTKPSFASPQPLAAASGLTIPLQITLSDIRLSGFVILVFSRQKGLTLVFRNDPLESLKVSSTFDSIPFVRDYLQKEIEGQLRVLFMEDLPAILHRLSLRLWSSEYIELDDMQKADSKDTEAPIDPLSTPPQNAVDAFGNLIDDSEISALSLDSPSETRASFSQKNLLRLATLTESHRTLALFTPSIREAVFRAWAGAAERDNLSGSNTPPLTLSSLSRIHSSFNIPTTASASSVSGMTEGSTTSSRPSVMTSPSTYSSIGVGAGRSRAQARKGKKRVVNLRRTQANAETASTTTETSTPAPSISLSEESSTIPEEELRDDLVTPPPSPEKTIDPSIKREDITLPSSHNLQAIASDDIMPPLPTPSTDSNNSPRHAAKYTSLPSLSTPERTKYSPRPSPLHHNRSSTALPLRTYSFDKLPFQKSRRYPSSAHMSTSPSPAETPLSGGILEQAWMMKMAKEIARKVQDEKERAAKGDENDPEANAESSSWNRKSTGFWERNSILAEDVDGEAPPAYME